MRSKVGSLADAGSGTVIAISLIAAISFLLALMFSLSNRFLEQTKLEVLAENSAIAGADSLRGLVTGSPCEVVRDIVLSGDARIITCSINQTDLLIQLERNGLTARARAGEPIQQEN